MSDELLDNMCIPKFTCGDMFDGVTPCALFADTIVANKDGGNSCRYYDLGACTSSVAQVNAMTIYMKRLGVE